MKEKQKSICVAACVIGLIAWSTVSSMALVIDFDGAGYTAGSDLYGQGNATGSSWGSSNPSSLIVTAGVGVDGTNALVSTLPAANTTEIYMPSTTDLPGFNGSSSLVNFSFQYRYDAVPTGSSFTQVLALNLGFYSVNWHRALDLYVANNGGFVVAGAAAKNSGGANYLVTDNTTWTTVSGTLDFGAKNSTVYVNGVLQRGGAIAWTDTAITQMGLQFVNINTASYSPVVIDNISVSVVPEPSTAAMMVMGTTLLFVTMRRRSLA